MIIHLMDVMGHMDLERSEGRLDSAQLRNIASQEGIWFMGFFHDNGNLALANRPVSEDVLKKAGPVIRGEEHILVHVFGPPEPDGIAGWLAFRRKWGKGSMVLALKPADVQFWRVKTAVQRAAENAGFEGEVGYLSVIDEQGRMLAAIGRIPAGRTDPGRQADDASPPGTRGTRKVRLDGTQLLEISVPVQLGKGVSGRILVALSRARADAMLATERTRGMVLMSFMGVIALLSMWLLYKNQNRHLRKMRAIEERLHQAQRLSALGRMAAGMAHEIRNPLNAISMACQRLNPANMDQLSEVIREEIRRLDQLVEAFLSLSRHRGLTFWSHDIKAVLRHVAVLMEEESSSKGIQLRCEWDDSALVIPMDGDRITQALLNIVKNAMEAVSHEGVVTLSVTKMDQTWAKITISDTGKGLTPEARKQMFDPDFTTKEKGLGLGLALAYEVIQGHGGDIRVMSKPGVGTTVKILLPLNR